MGYFDGVKSDVYHYEDEDNNDTQIMDKIVKSQNRIVKSQKELIYEQKELVESQKELSNKIDKVIEKWSKINRLIELLKKGNNFVMNVISNGLWNIYAIQNLTMTKHQKCLKGIKK